MKALTVRQPMAAHLVTGAKSIEWRDWEPPALGRILIHAGSVDSGRRCRAGIESIRGAIIGSVEIVAVERRTNGPHKLAWIVRYPEQLPEPIPAKGRLGLWEAPESTCEAIELRALRA